MMNNFDLYLPDLNNKRALCTEINQYVIKVIDIDTQQVLFQRKDLGGYHRCGIFTEDENIVIYITFDKHWYISPVINIWNLKEDSVDSIVTPHNSQLESMQIAYNMPKQHLVLGSYDGCISTYHIQTRKLIAHIPTQEANDSKKIIGLSISPCAEKIALLRKNSLEIYDVNRAKKLLSMALISTYSQCQFDDNKATVSITHPDKPPINIPY